MIYEGDIANDGVCQVVITEESGAEAGMTQHIGGGNDEQGESRGRGWVCRQVTQIAVGGHSENDFTLMTQVSITLFWARDGFGVTFWQDCSGSSVEKL